tara:strand:- start:8738 stop:9364 length:627 start_codon:yes stop_codon:yes gene_type:complete
MLNRIKKLFIKDKVWQPKVIDYYCWPKYPRVENFYFVNIPKNVSTTVLYWAQKIKTQEQTYRIQDPFRFTILRDPYGRLKSAFAYGVGQRFYYEHTVDSIGALLLEQNPVQRHEGLLTHFVPQHVFIKRAPVKVDHYYHTGQIRELHQYLSTISRVELPWLTENRSGYTDQFTEQYNAWFVKNTTWIDDYLAKDFILYNKVVHRAAAA